MIGKLLAAFNRAGPLDPAKAQSRLMAMVGEQGVDVAVLQPAQALAVFERFMATPVACADDGMLVEIGTHALPDNPGPGEWFSVSLVRQFSFEKDNEYDHMEQLCCLCVLPPRDELRSLKLISWTYDHPTLEAFFAFVRGTPEWRAAEREAGYRCTISQEWV